MSNLKRAKILAAAAFLAAAPLAFAAAQTTTSPPTSPTTSPPAARPESATPGTTPSDTTRSPATPDKSAAMTASSLVGLAVFSSDGSKISNVRSVTTEPDGKVKAIQFKTGGFLGFGGKVVSVPDGKFTRSGENIQLRMSADEVSKLPEVKEQG